MSKITSAIRTFIADEEGVTAIEYGLMAALIAGGLITAIGLLTTALDDTFTEITTAMEAAID